MGGYNKIILLGSLVRDPELRYTPRGTAVCTFPLEVEEEGPVRQESCSIDIVIFGRLGEKCKEYLRQGAQILVDGSLAQRRWESVAGTRESKYEVVARMVQSFTRSDAEGWHNGAGGGVREPQRKSRGKG